MRSRVLATGILAAIVLGLVWARFGGTPASAHAPHPGLNFWIAVDGVPSCSTKTANATCSLASGATFVLDSYLDPLPSDIQNYSGFDIAVRHSGITFNHDASTDVWPDCAFPAASYDEYSNSDPNRDIVTIACAVGLPPAGPSTYTGLMATISFVCTQSGSISLIHGLTNTDLVGMNPGEMHAEDPNTTETLTINCVAGGAVPPTPVPVAGQTSAPPGTPLPPTAQAQATATAKAKATAAAKGTPTTTINVAGGGGGGLSAGVIAIIVIAAVVVAGGAGFFGWRYLQSRRGAGGGT